MKETIDVSIAGIGFKFETDAYEIIRVYLERIGRKYSSNPDGAEIINDIEARIVEIILTEQSAEQIVGRPLIDMVVGRVGLPEDMGTEDTGVVVDFDMPQIKFPKRLYRNPEGAKAGGVMTGLATFFHADPSLLRMAFFIPGIFSLIFFVAKWENIGGFCLVVQLICALLYILMWMVVPLARTPRQKLEMQGMNITASSIENEARLSGEVMPKGASRISAVFTGLFVWIGKLLTLLLQIFVGAVGAAFALLAVAIVSGMVYMVINGEPWIVEKIGGSRDIVWTGSSVLRWDIVIASLVLFIPVVMISVAFLNLLVKRKISYIFYLVLGGLWLVAVGYTSIKIPQDFKYVQEYNLKSTLVWDLNRRGYITVKDQEGNILVAQDTIYYAGEDITVEGMARRINRLFEGEYKVQIYPIPTWEGLAFNISQQPGPKLEAAQRAAVPDDLYIGGGRMPHQFPPQEEIIMEVKKDPVEIK